MPKAEVSIVVKAYDAATRVLKSVSGAVSGIAGTIGKAVKWGAIGAITGASAAVAGLTYWMVKEANAQTQAEASLRGVLMGFGQLGKALDATMGKYKALSEAIMKETGIGDDQTLGMIAQLQQMGVLESQMEAATRAVYGLASVGVEGEAAMRGIANALQGNYAALSRFVPTIRNANTEQEKQAAFAKLAAVGYGVVQAKLQTVAGAFGALKGQVGELLEAIGMTVFSGGNLAEVFLRLRDRVADLGQSEGFKRFLAWIKEATIEASALAKILVGMGDTVSAGEAWKGVGNVIVTALEYGGATLANMIYEAAVAAGRKIKEEVVGQNPSRSKDATWLEKAFPMTTSIGADMGAASVAVDRFIEKIADTTAAKKRFEDALKAAGNMARSEILAGVRPGVSDPNANPNTRRYTAPVASNGLGVATADRINQLAANTVEENKRYVDSLEDQDKLLDDQIDKLTEIRDKNAEIANEPAFGKAFNEWRDNQKAKAEDAALAAEQQGRFRKLADKEARGRKLGKEEKQFLADMRARELEKTIAAGRVDAAQAGLVAAQAARDLVQERIAKAHEDLAKAQADFAKQLERNLTAPGGG